MAKGKEGVGACAFCEALDGVVAGIDVAFVYYGGAVSPRWGGPFRTEPRADNLDGVDSVDESVRKEEKRFSLPGRCGEAVVKVDVPVSLLSEGPVTISIACPKG